MAGPVNDQGGWYEVAESGSRQVFGAVANAGTDLVALIRHMLDAMGRTGDTVLSAFTDGCSGLRAILAAAGVTGLPIADWFHLSMRLQHAKLVAEALLAGDADQQQAKAEVVAEVERLRWRVWHGKVRNAQLTLKRLRTLLPGLEREPARKLKRALWVVDRYLRSQSAWLVNYAERWRAGLRVGTSLTEGTANFLVNKRMAKSQQCGGPGAALTCCCKSATPSTTEHSISASANCSGRHPDQAYRGWRRRSPPTSRQSLFLPLTAARAPSTSRKDDETKASALAFLREAASAFPFHLTHVLTDNGCCFTPAFARACAALGAEYRHTKPRTPQTNGRAMRKFG